MDTTEIITHLHLIPAGMAYLNAGNHRAGMQAAIKAAGAYALPGADIAARTEALHAALEIYPQFDYERHDDRLQAALIAAARMLYAPS